MSIALALGVLGQVGCQALFGSGSTLPSALSDAAFWDLSTGLSEAPGTFDHSENLVSNEHRFVHLARVLRPSGGVYIGVGPEQNFSYIARLQPAMAFIIDVRSENRSLHLLYKALFEMASDRADFVSRLFSRPRPPTLPSTASVGDLFTEYARTPAVDQVFDDNARRIREHLSVTRRLPLSAVDLASIERAFEAFYTDGPDIHYGRSLPNDSPGPSYRVLMTAVDVAGQPRSFLATEEGFVVVKDLQSSNLIVPVVGNFAGPDAIRRVGDYVRGRGDVVSAFYASNVEVYLNRQERAAFCRNLTALPHDSGTWFIGSKGLQRFGSKLASCARSGR